MRIRESRYTFPTTVQRTLKPRAAILFLSKLESVTISSYFFEAFDFMTVLITFICILCHSFHQGREINDGLHA